MKFPKEVLVVGWGKWAILPPILHQQFDVKFVSTWLILIVLSTLKCSSENVVYLFTCKTCSKQYTESTEDFRPRFNNYRCNHINFLKRKKVKQESFNAHFAEVNHNGEDDWQVRLIEQTDNVEELRKRESFWQHELDTFQPNGLNEREVALF